MVSVVFVSVVFSVVSVFMLILLSFRLLTLLLLLSLTFLMLMLFSVVFVVISVVVVGVFCLYCCCSFCFSFCSYNDKIIFDIEKEPLICYCMAFMFCLIDMGRACGRLFLSYVASYEESITQILFLTGHFTAVVFPFCQTADLC